MANNSCCDSSARTLNWLSHKTFLFRSTISHITQYPRGNRNISPFICYLFSIDPRDRETDQSSDSDACAPCPRAPWTHFIDETIEQVVMLFYCFSTLYTHTGRSDRYKGLATCPFPSHCTHSIQLHGCMQPMQNWFSSIFPSPCSVNSWTLNSTENISMATSIPYFARWSCEPTSN